MKKERGLRNDIAIRKNRLCAMPEFSAVKQQSNKKQITLPFDKCATLIKHEKLIAVIHDSLNRFEENDYPQLLSQMTDWAQSVPVTEHCVRFRQPENHG